MEEEVKVELINKDNTKHVYSCNRIRRTDNKRLRVRIYAKDVKSAWVDLKWVGDKKFLMFYIKSEKHVDEIVFNVETTRMKTLKRFVKGFKSNGMKIGGL